MKNKNHRLFLLNIGMLPLVWGIFQGYHLFICKPIGERMLAAFPQFFEQFQMSYPLAVALINLVFFGTLAMIWPHLGFGDAWRANRHHSLIIFSIIVVSLFAPIFNGFWESANPFKEMGWVTWTLTPVEEEILFRGFLYTLLLRLFRQTPYSSWRKVLPVLLLGAVWFALWHIYPPAIEKHGWRVVGLQAIMTFFAGILFNGLRHWTGSIWFVIPVHAAGNFMVSLM